MATRLGWDPLRLLFLLLPLILVGQAGLLLAATRRLLDLLPLRAAPRSESPPSARRSRCARRGHRFSKVYSKVTRSACLNSASCARAARDGFSGDCCLCTRLTSCPTAPSSSALFRNHLCPRLGPRHRSVLPADSRPSSLLCAEPTLAAALRSALKPTTPEALLFIDTASLCARMEPSVLSPQLLPPRHLSLHLLFFGAARQSTLTDRCRPHSTLSTRTSRSPRRSTSRWRSTSRRLRLAELPHGAFQVRSAAATVPAPQFASCPSVGPLACCFG